MSAAPVAIAPAKKKKGKLVLIIACVLALSAGAATPMVVDVPGLMGNKTSAAEGKETKKKKAKHDESLVTVPVGEVAVNLSEDRMTRYLRLKVAVQVEATAEKKVTELVEKQKVSLKSWMIGHVAGKTLKDVSGTVGVNRLQREFMERFDDILYSNGDSPIRAVLFEEYLVQ